MALSTTDKNEIEVLIRKEIKDFLGNNTMKQYEDKLIDSIAKQIKRGKVDRLVSTTTTTTTTQGLLLWIDS